MDAAPAPIGHVRPQQRPRFRHGGAQRFQQDRLRHAILRLAQQRGGGGQQRHDVGRADGAPVRPHIRRHHVRHRHARQMPAGPDFIKGGGCRIGGFARVPAGQQCQPGTVIIAAALQAGQQRHGGSGQRAGHIGLQRHGIGDAELRLGGQHFADAVDAAAICPFIAHGEGEAGGQVHFIGGGHPACRRVEFLRQQRCILQAAPAIGFARRHRQQAIAGGAIRHCPARRPADVAIGAGKHQVQVWRPPGLARGQKILPIAGLEQPCGLKIGRRTGQRPSGAQRKAAPAGGIAVDDGAIGGEFQHHIARRFAFHLDAFGHPGGGGARRVHHQILLIGIEDGQPPGHPAIMAEADAGQRRLPGAGQLEPGRIQMHQIPQGWQLVFAVRVIGQYRPAGGAAGRGHHPIVAAFLPFRVKPLHQLLAIKADTGGAQIIIGQHIGGDAAHIQSLGPVQHMRRGERLAHLIILAIIAAQRAGAGHFRIDIAGQPVGTDAHHIVHIPAFRLAGGRAELLRQRRCAGSSGGDIGVDAGDKGRGPFLGLRGIGRPFRRHVTAIQQQAGRAILRHKAGAKAGRQPAQAALAPQINLPQPVARHLPALREKRIMRAGGKDVRDAGAVHDNLHRRRHPRHRTAGLAHPRRHRRLRRARQQQRHHANHHPHLPAPFPGLLASLSSRPWISARNIMASLKWG